MLNWGRYIWTIETIHDMVLLDRRLTVRKIMKVTKILNVPRFSILNDYLSIRKLSARWVPCLRTFGHRRSCVTTSKESLALCQFRRVLCHFITVDKIWIHHITLETKDGMSIIHIFVFRDVHGLLWPVQRWYV